MPGRFCWKSVPHWDSTGFLVLHDFEVQDLIVLIEAKSSGMPEEEYRPFLLKANLLPEH